jgi:hypothetical protein
MTDQTDREDALDPGEVTPYTLPRGVLQLFHVFVQDEEEPWTLSMPDSDDEPTRPARVTKGFNRRNFL